MIKEMMKPKNKMEMARTSGACFFPTGWGLMGGDTCCCGNYPGCCVYANILCCIHDNICYCCGRWYCGFQCKPGNGC